jgi:transposase
VREKFSCRDCEAITEAPAPFHPIPRGFAGPSLLAMVLVLVNKFLLHQPLNRQSKTYAREGIEIDVSTLADRVGACVVALDSIIEAIRIHVMSAERIHADDTTVPVLAKLKTVTGRIWTYVRDDRPFGCTDPPAALFYYSRNRAGEHPQSHLAGYVGLMQADAFDGYNQLYKAQRKPAPILEAACWSHGRRKFFELAKSGEAPIASEAVRRIDILFEVERTINGKTPEQRLAVRREKSAPIVADLEIWMRQQRTLLSSGNDTEGHQLPAQPLGGVHPLPGRRPHLPLEQRCRTSATRCGCRETKLDLRRFRCWRPSCRRRLHPDRDLQDERR